MSMMAYQVPREVPRRRRTSPWAFVPLVVPFLILLAVALFATYRSHTPKLTPPPGLRGSLVWGDAIFANRTEVKAWMTNHGASYDSWARHHPAALKLLLPARHAKKR